MKKHPGYIDFSLTERERKNLTILETIRKSGPITRTDISKATDLNIVTVTNYVNEYIEKTIVSECGLEASSGGRRPTLVKLNEKAAYALGLDLGTTDARGGLMTAVITDLGGKLIKKITCPRQKEPMDRIINRGIELIRDILDQNTVPREAVRGVGLGAAGVIDEEAGTVRDTTQGGARTSYVQALEQIEREFNFPTYIGNDATFAAFGEKMHGLPSDVENILYVYSDVGCGIIVKGGIYCGATGSAGEIGINVPSEDEHLSLAMGPCYIRPGGIDLGLSQQARKMLQEGIKSTIVDYVDGDLNAITIDTIIKAAQDGDLLAQELIENAGVVLGIRISYLINLFNPEIVIIGGGIEKAGSFIIDPLIKTVRKWAFEEPANLVRIIPAQLGPDSIAMGAASIVIRQIFIQRI